MGSGPVRPADEHARALGGQQVRVGEMGGFQGGGGGVYLYSILSGIRIFTKKVNNFFLLYGREKKMTKKLKT